MSRALVCALVLSGCATVQTTGIHRSPALGEAPLPAPIVLWSTTSCLSLGETTGKLGDRPELDAQLRRALSASPELPALTRAEHVCRALAPDPLFLEDAMAGPRWQVPATLSDEVRAAASAAGARTVVVPITRARSACRSRDPFFQERQGVIPDRAGPPECGDDPRRDLGLFAFDASGALLWRATGTSADGTTPAMLDLLHGLLTRLPRGANAP